MKINKNILKNIIVVLCVVAIIAILGLFIYGIIDFANDYRCSTTTDYQWWIENNCQRYIK